MQYPHLHPVDGRSIPDVPEHLIPELVRICKYVRKMTGCSGWYHQGLKGIQWHIGDEPNGGPYADILFQGGRYLPIVVNETIERLHAATNTSRADKDKESARRLAHSEAKKQYEISSRAIALAPELRSRIEYNMRKADNKHSQRIFTMTD